MFTQRFHMFFCCISPAVIGSIAFNNGSADIVDDRLPEVGLQEILVSNLAGMQFNGYPAVKRFVD